MKKIQPKNDDYYVSISIEYPQPEASLDETVKADSFWSKVGRSAAAASLIFTLGLNALNSGCGDSGNGNPDSGSDVYRPDSDVSPSNPLAPISSSSITPTDGKKVTSSDSPLTVGFKVPGKNPNYAGSDPSGIGAKVTASGDNATPSDTSDDWTTTITSKNGAKLDELVGGTLDLTTANNGSELKDGEKVKFGFEATAKGEDGKDYTQSATSTVSYEGTTNKLQVTGCYVTFSAAGGGFGAQCSCKDPNGKKVTWNLTSDLTGAGISSIDDTTAIIAKGVLSDADVGIHSFSTTCNNGTETSAQYSFLVPVDAHRSTLTLKCSDGTNNTLLLPETSVDAVSKQCASGFNASLKPSNSSSQAYVLDVTSTCVEGAINGLAAAEKLAHKNYNQGKTVSDVYKSCTVNFAQTAYTSKKK